MPCLSKWRVSPQAAARGGSDQGHGFGRAIEASRVGIGKCGQCCGRCYANASANGARDIREDRQRTSQRVQRAALIVHIQDAVMMIGTARSSGSDEVMIAVGLSRDEHIHRVLILSTAKRRRPGPT